MSAASRELQQLDEVEDLLQAYAEARLSPGALVRSRIRAAVMTEAALASATAAAERGAADLAHAEPSRWILPRLRVPRRAFALGVAATMTLATGAAVVAAPPGSPLYDARVAIETALLPTQPDARLASHEQHLAERLAEAQAAAASGDPAGLQAALAAYAAEVNAALADLGDDADLLAHLEAVLGRHVVTLTTLEAEVPEEASIDQAIESSQKAVEKINEKGTSSGNPGTGGRPDYVPAGPDNAPNR